MYPLKGRLVAYKDRPAYKVKYNRRDFLKCGVMAGLVSILPAPVYAARRLFQPLERSLHLYHLQTDKSLDILYCRQGKYLPEALAKINYFLRDHRTNEMIPIDKRLIDLLYDISKKLRADHPFHIISGYRSPSTNSYLRKCCSGVARNSLHMFGKAVDITLPNCKLSSLRHVAVEMRAGGVGYYPARNFIHVDVGRVRYW